jgi:uncharacterized flavoprotein (TIGR03862 family)
MTRSAETIEAVVIGAGPAGLMAAEILAKGGARVVVFEGMPSPARKFLLAGRGGLNLTHGESVDAFLPRYGGARDLLEPAIRAFPPDALRTWSAALGEETFAGSSGRVFPKSFKASPLLRAWLRKLGQTGVELRTRHRWLGWSEEGALRFDTADGEISVHTKATVLALGGASWPKLGANGAWTSLLAARGVAVTKLAPSNAGFEAGWSEHFSSRFRGQPLKRIAVSFGGKTVRGEAMVTEIGLEGGAIYALSPLLREAIAASGSATVAIDLRPDVTAAALAEKLSVPRGKQSLANVLRKSAGLSPAAAGLLNEIARRQGSPLSALAADSIAALIRALPLRLMAMAPLDRAISTAGGIARGELDPHFMLQRLPGVFAAGEMLDWEAPTGGYLLQACFSTGVAAGEGALEWLKLQDG